MRRIYTFEIEKVPEEGKPGSWVFRPNAHDDLMLIHGQRGISYTPDNPFCYMNYIIDPDTGEPKECEIEIDVDDREHGILMRKAKSHREVA